MNQVPETKYARSGDVFIAYQVAGEGPVDIVFFGPLVGHVDLIWEDPVAARFFHRLGSFSRLILFDKRGTGMSDPVPIRDLPTLEQRMEDVLAVMDAVGCERAVLVGSSEGGQLAILTAATHPQRTAGIVLHASYARPARADDHPIGLPESAAARLLDGIAEFWGSDELLHIVLPSAAGDPHRVRWWEDFARRSSSPGAVVAQIRMNLESDVRHVLPTVRVPCLVLHAAGDQWIRVGHGRHLAEHIPGARYIELPGADHLPYGDHADTLATEIREFVTGVREPAEPDRVLATVMFSDIASSTEQLAAVGDTRWRDLLDTHDRAIRRQLERHRGREIKTTGDGFLAVFDGPARAIRCAEAIRDATNALGLSVRVGVHTGEIELRNGDVAGMGVHISQRVCGLAGPSEVLVSAAVPMLVAGSGIAFADRGEHELKGVPDRWRVYAVADS